jgi:hypothetical protein
MPEETCPPLPSKKTFIRKFLKSILFANLFIAASLFMGMVGYHWFSGLNWVDAFLNASMILTGMGPVSPMPSDAAKIFSSCYAIFSGVAFLSMIGVVITPVAHRFLHKFHLEIEEDDKEQ